MPRSAGGKPQSRTGAPDSGLGAAIASLPAPGQIAGTFTPGRHAQADRPLAALRRPHRQLRAERDGVGDDAGMPGSGPGGRRSRVRPPPCLAPPSRRAPRARSRESGLRRPPVLRPCRSPTAGHPWPRPAERHAAGPGIRPSARPRHSPPRLLASVRPSAAPLRRLTLAPPGNRPGAPFHQQQPHSVPSGVPAPGASPLPGGRGE